MPEPQDEVLCVLSVDSTGHPVRSIAAGTVRRASVLSASGKATLS
ncbi:hypothetical protein [[Kitasatospora] papulosa]